MRLWRFWRNERGNIAILFAAGFSIAAVVGAIAVDAGSLYFERRQTQAAVDVAALSAVTDPARAQLLARNAITGAGLDSQLAAGTLTVTTGRYTPNAALAPAARFVAGATPINAVRVSLRHAGTLHFASSFTQSPIIEAHALATVTPEVAYSLGSRLASLNNGIANSLLGGLLGTTVSLSVADYNNLAAVNVDLFSFMNALAQKLNITAGSYNNLLTANATAGQLAGALATVVTGAEKTVLNTLAAAGAGKTIPLNKLLNLGRYGGITIGSTQTPLAAKVSALDLLSAAASLANGTKQLDIGLNLNVPGIISSKATVFVGEPAQGGGWYAVGPAGTTLRTSQVRLRLDVRVLGNATLQNSVLSLPMWLDLAHSEATVQSATCPTTGSPNGTATIAVLPGALRLAIGEITDSALRNFGVPLTVKPVAILSAVNLLGLTVLKLVASAQVSIAQTTPILLNFNSTEIGQATLKQAKVQTPITSLTQSLFNGLVITPEVLGIGLPLEAVIKAAVSTLIAPLAPLLDVVIYNLLNTLGLGVGEADVRVYAVRCTTPVLVG